LPEAKQEEGHERRGLEGGLVAERGKTLEGRESP
jgi:hypothetical protein